jgi:hypothetical protein
MFALSPKIYKGKNESLQSSLLTKLSLAGDKLVIPAQGEFGLWHPGWGRENR